MNFTLSSSFWYGELSATWGDMRLKVCLFVCLLDVSPPSNMQRISQGRICSDKCTCCHTVTEVADQTCYLTHSHYPYTEQFSPSTTRAMHRVEQPTHFKFLHDLTGETGFVCLLVGCLSSQQHAIAPQGRICSDNCTCCHTEIEVADQTFYLTQSQYTDTGQTSLSADNIMPGAWQGSHVECQC